MNQTFINKFAFLKKDGLIKGTLILTIAGFITRIIGFFYRIFLSNHMDADKLGIYQLIFPVYGIAFTIYAAGIQTSISKLVASAYANYDRRKARSILRIGALLSFSISILISFIIYFNSDYIAWRLLLEKESSSSIKVLVLLFPFCSITSCINGYYYGMKKATVPAATQLFEQIIRVITVYLAAIFFSNNTQKLSCELAVTGIVIGEIFSCLFNIISMLLSGKNEKIDISNNKSNNKKILYKLIKLSLPLSSNRLIVSILTSIEAVLIPSMLKKTGLSTETSLSIFGILNGMSLPFILFPSTIANSFSVMLLPVISEAQACDNDKLISFTVSLSIKYSILIGILSTGIFIVFGNDLGLLIFNNKLAGEFLTILAWLCPFLYLASTLSSVINGLGKAHITFLNTISGLLIRILFIVLLTPLKGIEGYLIGLLVSQLTISLLDVYTVNKYVKINFNAYNWILKPMLIMFFSSMIISKTYKYVLNMIRFNHLLTLLLSILITTISYILLLLMSKAITKSEFTTKS